MGGWAAILAGCALLACGSAASLGADADALPKDLPLPTDVTVAIYLPQPLRDFRAAFRWSGGFQTTDAVQLGSSLEELTLEAARPYFKSSFMYEPARPAPFGLLVAIHPSLKSEDGQLVVTAHYRAYGADGTAALKGDAVARWAPSSGVRAPDVLGALEK